MPVPQSDLPDNLRVPPSDLPDRQGELAAAAGPRGYTYMGRVVKPGQESNVIEDITGGAPGMGAMVGTFAGSRVMPDEEGVAPMSKLARGALTAAGAGAGAGLGAAVSGKDVVSNAIGAMGGELAAPALAAPFKWAGQQLKTTFESSKYIGKIGQKIAEHFGLDKPLKTSHDLYNFMRYDPNKSVFDSEAGDVAKAAYRQSAQAIENAVGKGAEIGGDAARGLREILYQALPSFQRETERQLSRDYARGVENAALNEGIRGQWFSGPLKVTDAMEMARELGQIAATKGGAAGEANKAYRDLLDQSIAQMSKDPNIGRGAYAAMNDLYAKRMTFLRSFDSQKLFKTGTGTPSLIRPKLIKASNDAERSLTKVGMKDLDETIRMGNPPGRTSSTLNLGGSGHIWGIGARYHLPHKEFEVFPLRPPLTPSQQIANTVLRALGARIGTNNGEQPEQNQAGR